MRSIEVFFAIALLFGASQASSQITNFFDEQGIDADSTKAIYSITYVNNVSKSYYLNPKRVRYEEREIENGAVMRTYYYPTGQVHATGRFLKGRLNGLTKSFYKNGSPQGELEFESYELSRVSVIRIINYWDSIGNKMIDNGVGICSCVLNPFENVGIVEKGQVANQLKEGEWTASTSTYSYRENYQGGELQRGTINYHGETFEYDKIEESAEPIGGMVAFYKHIGSVIRYPAKARRKGYQGRVFVQFVVQKDGTLTNLRVIKGIEGGCNEEALRAVMSSPKWKPGRQRGRPVKQRYTLPIEFKLG